MYLQDKHYFMLGYILKVSLKTNFSGELSEDGECDQISLCEFLKN